MGCADKYNFDEAVIDVLKQSQVVENLLRQVPELKNKDVSLDTSGRLINKLIEINPEVFVKEEIENVKKVIAERNWVIHS